MAMDKDALVEDFMIQYGEALNNIGFTTRDIMRFQPTDSEVLKSSSLSIRVLSAE